MDRSLGELVALISTHVSTITKFLDVNSLPHPSFAVNAPAGLPGDANVQRARFALIEAATDLIHLATGPEDYIKLQSLEVCFILALGGSINLAGTLWLYTMH
jgi:6-hydroxytryprostatin B O-methyltransferase